MTEQEIEVNEEPHSVEVSINAKGQWAGKVKVYAKSIDNAMSAALIKAGQLSKIIAKKNKAPKEQTINEHHGLKP